MAPELLLMQVKLRRLRTHWCDLLASCLGAKRFELLRYFVSNAATIAMPVNPNYPAAAAEVHDVHVAARSGCCGSMLPPRNPLLLKSLGKDGL